MGFGNRGIVADKWSGRLLWVCAIGSAVGIPSISFDFFLRFFSLDKQWYWTGRKSTTNKLASMPRLN